MLSMSPGMGCVRQHLLWFSHISTNCPGVPYVTPTCARLSNDFARVKPPGCGQTLRAAN